MYAMMKIDVIQITWKLFSYYPAIKFPANSLSLFNQYCIRYEYDRFFYDFLCSNWEVIFRTQYLSFLDYIEPTPQVNTFVITAEIHCFVIF